MNTDDSSFREMYQYPNDGHIHKHRKYVVKGQKAKKDIKESTQPQK